MLEKFLRTFRKQGELPEPWRTPRYLEIPYDPSLVMALTHQHRTLAMLLVQASSAALLGAFKEVGGLLEQFESALDAHLKQERERLHPYLAERIKGEDGQQALQEMYLHVGLIRRSVEGFLKHYRDNPVDASNLEEFEEDIEMVSEELSQELEREEAIFYTLYLPPEEY